MLSLKDQSAKFAEETEDILKQYFGRDADDFIIHMVTNKILNLYSDSQKELVEFIIDKLEGGE